MTQARRRPVEAIESRNQRAVECEERVRKAVAKLAKTGLPFTPSKRSADEPTSEIPSSTTRNAPGLTKLVLAARDTSQLATRARGAEQDLADTASWRERALNAEARIKDLRAALRQQDAHIGDLNGQLFDPEGNNFADENARLRGRVDALNQQVTNMRNEFTVAQRSLQASRANVRREQERN